MEGVVVTVNVVVTEPLEGGVTVTGLKLPEMFAFVAVMPNVTGALYPSIEIMVTE